MLTRKHYRLIAREIKRQPRDSQDVFFALFSLASDLSVEFKEDNPRFDKSRFMEACGYGDV